MSVLVKYQKDLQGKMTAAGMPKEAVIRELSFAKQIFDASPYIQECDPNSILSAIVNVANIGLTLNPAAKESYIVPRYNSKSRTKEAHLMPSYIGLIKLIIQEGSVNSIQAQLVYANDEFKYQPTDSENPVIHSANPFGDRGELMGVYALAVLRDGTKQAEVMHIADVKAIRENSESYKNERTRQHSPWVKHFEEMTRKTIVRRIFKYLPRGNNEVNEVISKAIELDNQDNAATFGQIGLIDSMLLSSTLSPEQQEQIEAAMHDFTYQRASECITYLKENQQEPRDPAKQFKARAK